MLLSCNGLQKIIEAESFMIRETGVYKRKKELQACVPDGKRLLYKN